MVRSEFLIYPNSCLYKKHDFSKYLSISVAASFIGVCTKTLRHWHATGVFEPDFRTPGGYRRYSLSRLEAFYSREMKHDEKRSKKMHDEGIKGNTVKVAAIYARVSARKQLDDLQRQLSFPERRVQDAVFKKVMLYKDVASGVNDSRNGMKKLLRANGFVDPRGTSSTCPRCGHRLIRTPQNWDVVFCPKCKKKMNATVVAAIQIARKKPFKIEKGLFIKKPDLTIPGSRSLPALGIECPNLPNFIRSVIFKQCRHYEIFNIHCKTL